MNNWQLMPSMPMMLLEEVFSKPAPITRQPSQVTNPNHSNLPKGTSHPLL
jgi:hypothetical protein